MNYIITGSLGNISKPLAENLIKAGHRVTIVTTNQARASAIEALGAVAAVGSVEDGVFLDKTFSGADAIYLMIPPNWMPEGGWFSYQKKVADNFIASIKKSKVKSIVLLSSIGAHLRKGTGPVDGLGYAEEKLMELKEVNVKVLRPSYFFYNLFGMIPLVKNMNIMGSNFGSTAEKLVLTHTNDIAEVATNALLNLSFKGYSIDYIASDERHPREIAEVLGKAVGKQNLPWVEFKDEDALQGMLQNGLAPTIAEGYVTMGASIRSGKVQEDYWKNRPTLGRYNLEDFAKEFAKAYHQ